MHDKRENLERLLQSAYDLQCRQQAADFAAYKKMPNIPKHTSEGLGLALDLVFFVASLVVPMPVVWKWGLWILCWTAFAFLVLPFFHVLGLKRKLSIGIAPLLFVVIFFSTARDQYLEEKAAKQEGDLRVENPTRLSQPMVQLANSRVAFPTDSKAPLKLFKDAELSFGLDEEGSTTISTIIEDRQGHRLVQITRNHWQVYEDTGDKNYTDDALEVLDKGGHVVLQLRLLPDRLVLWGEWHDEFDHAAQLTMCPDLRSPSGQSACFKIFGSALPEKDTKAHLEPMFEYPSKKHWREFRKK